VTETTLRAVAGTRMEKHVSNALSYDRHISNRTIRTADVAISYTSCTAIIQDGQQSPISLGSRTIRRSNIDGDDDLLALLFPTEKGGHGGQVTGHEVYLETLLKPGTAYGPERLNMDNLNGSLSWSSQETAQFHRSLSWE